VAKSSLTPEDIIGLVTEPTSGRLSLGGKEIYGSRRPNLEKVRREEVGFIFQAANLVPFLTAKENVLLPLDLLETPRKEAHARARGLLNYLGVAARAELYPNQLSGGEKQRVAIARALANKPRFVLADEPTAALDTERGLSVMRLLRKVAAEQKSAIVAVTHDTRMIDEGDCVIELRDGRVAAEKRNTVVGDRESQ
jgi:putative ABC transport system ATP-binding protein